MNNLLEPQPAKHMGQGWETRRSRPPGDDWVVIKLGQPGHLTRIVVDTAFFKGNFPDHCTIQALYWPNAPARDLVRHPDWQPITARHRLSADAKHEPVQPGPDHIRLCIVPDGGVSRLRVMGTVAATTPAEKDTLLRRLNDMADNELSEALTRCCGSTRWVQRMVQARPFTSRTHLFSEARRHWWALGDGDWHEAFTHHPEIGANIEHLRAKFADTANWSADEQAGAGQASEATLEALAAGNRQYAQQFGFIFIVCASGKSAQEMLELLNARLSNELAYELRIAAGEQQKLPNYESHDLKKRTEVETQHESNYYHILDTALGHGPDVGVLLEVMVANEGSWSAGPMTTDATKT